MSRNEFDGVREDLGRVSLNASREQSARILHVHKHHVHAAFFRELPSGAFAEHRKYTKLGFLLVGAVGIEPTTSPV